LKKKLIIIGAGGFGREILAWAEDAQNASDKAGDDWEVYGFLDGNQEALSGFDIDLPIVGDPATHQPTSDERFVCAIGDPQTKLDVCRALVARGAQFINLIHPTALIGPRCEFGVGTILCPFAAITVDAHLGNFVTLNLRAGIGHDVQVGDGTTLNAFCDVTGGAKLGEGVFLGSHAVVAPRVSVGNYARVGAGSVVVRRVKPNSSVMGVPAKRLGFSTPATIPLQEPQTELKAA
jgi:sugar O-acyltransferase (sialic acid O-acetyltransferase NeuD family)